MRNESKERQLQKSLTKCDAQVEVHRVVLEATAVINVTSRGILQEQSRAECFLAFTSIKVTLCGAANYTLFTLSWILGTILCGK